MTLPLIQNDCRSPKHAIRKTKLRVKIADFALVTAHFKPKIITVYSDDDVIDACCWLRSAGYHKYVELFKGIFTSCSSLSRSKKTNISSASTNLAFIEFWCKIKWAPTNLKILEGTHPIEIMIEDFQFMSPNEFMSLQR